MFRKQLLKRAAAGIAALVIVFGAAGCQRVPVGVETVPPQESAEAVPTGAEGTALAEKETGEPYSEDTPAPADTAEAGTVETAAETPEAAETCQTAKVSEEAAPLPETEETAPEQPPAQTTAITTAQTSEQTPEQPTPQTTAQTTEKPKPAEVVIPEVKKLSSPGTATAAADTAVIDYSNASLGYISVSYTGASDKVKLRLINGEVSNDHNIAPDGTVEYIPLSLGSGKYKMELYERVEGKMYAVVLETEADVKIADDVGMYLYPNKYCMFTGKSACVKKAAELCAGAEGTVEKVAAIFGWVTDSVSYDYDLAATVTSRYVPDPDSTLSKRTGICFDYASLTAAMTRSQGIPTRMVIGYATDIYHAWNEVWTEETGWITPELLLSRKGYNRIDPTFYSSNPNKEKISEFISDNGKYSAVYYY